MAAATARVARRPPFWSALVVVVLVGTATQWWGVHDVGAPTSSSSSPAALPAASSPPSLPSSSPSSSASLPLSLSAASSTTTPLPTHTLAPTTFASASRDIDVDRVCSSAVERVEPQRRRDDDTFDANVPDDYVADPLHPLAADDGDDGDDGDTTHHSSSSTRPYLSIVLVSIVSDWGGARGARSLVNRTQNVVNHLAHTFARAAFADYELLFVEWNPFVEYANETLLDALWWPAAVPVVRVFSVVARGDVPTSTGRVDEYLAKNVGVRRARGRFVLVLNSDVLPSAALLEWLAARRVPGDGVHVFREVRVQCASALPAPPHASLDELARVSDEVFAAPEFVPHLAANMGDFFLMHRRAWHALRGYWEELKLPVADNHLLHLALAHRSLRVHTLSAFVDAEHAEPLPDYRKAGDAHRWSRRFFLCHQAHEKSWGGLAPRSDAARAYNGAVLTTLRRADRPVLPALHNARASWALGDVPLRASCVVGGRVIVGRRVNVVRFDGAFVWPNASVPRPPVRRVALVDVIDGRAAVE